MSINYNRRKNRRRAIAEIINKLELILKAEEKYYNSLADNPLFYNQECESECTLTMIDEAIDSLRSTYEDSYVPF